MPAPSLRPRSLALGDEDLPLFSGAMHYFRVARRDWKACLRAVRSLGFGLVESYVPWGVHELGPGRFRFAGELDLAAFLDEAAGEGLRVLLRPGPHVNAELTYFGLPERIVRDERMQAKTGRGTPALVMAPPCSFAAPSYFSRRFLDEVRAWYAAVGEVVAPRLWPRGPVVALQVDNELGHFFRAGAFDGDYHEDALAAWHEAAGAMDPPRRFVVAKKEDLGPLLAWLAFKERGLTLALERLSGFIVAAGLGEVPRFHNFPPLEPGIYDVAAAETVVDFAGIDLYHHRSDYPRVRRRALYLAGSSRLPYVPECGVGSFAWGPDFDDRDSLAELLAALMHGVGGANLYMLVDRDRWYGAPISPAGEVRPGLGPTIARLLAALQQAGWSELVRAAEVGVILPRGYGRLALAASHLGPVGPAIPDWLRIDERAVAREARFGLAGPVQLEQARWRDGLLGALSAARVPFAIVDASAPAGLLARYQVLVVPTFDFLDADLAARLRAWAAGGGLLVSGPRQPTLDAAMQQAEVGLPGPRLDLALIDDEARLAATLATLCAGRCGRHEAAAREAEVDTTVHLGPGGAPVLRFVANRAARPLRATIDLGAPEELADVLTGERFSGAAPSLALAPYEVRLLRVTS